MIWESFLAHCQTYSWNWKFSQWSIYWVSVKLNSLHWSQLSLITHLDSGIPCIFKVVKSERQFNLVPSEEQGVSMSQNSLWICFPFTQMFKIPHVRSQNCFRSIAFSSYFIISVKKSWLLLLYLWPLKRGKSYYFWTDLAYTHGLKTRCCK